MLAIAGPTNRPETPPTTLNIQSFWSETRCNCGLGRERPDANPSRVQFSLDCEEAQGWQGVEEVKLRMRRNAETRR